MSEYEFHKAVIKELCTMHRFDMPMAEAVVYAGPSEEYLSDCIAEGCTATQTAQGFTDFQNQYMVNLVSNARTNVDGKSVTQTDDIPF